MSIGPGCRKRQLGVSRSGGIVTVESNSSARSIERRAQGADERHPVAAVAVILAVSLVLRIAFRALAGPSSFWANSYIFYFKLAASLAHGDGYALVPGAPSAMRVPFYSLFIAAVTQGQHNFWSLVIAQALVSTGTVACAYALARSLFGQRAALIAAAVTGLYPYYVWHDTALQETGCLTFLTALATLLLVITRRDRSMIAAAAAGLVLGLAILTRATLAPFALFAVAWLMVPDSVDRGVVRRGRTALMCLALIAAILAPWLARQHSVTGHWVLGTELGRSVFVGNNAATFSVYPQGSIDRSQANAFNALSVTDRAELGAMHGNEIAKSDWLLRRGLDYIRAHPGEFVVNGLRKNLAAFGWLPSPRHGLVVDLVEALSYGPIMVLGLLGMWQGRGNWRVHSLFYGQFLLFAAITAILWGHSSHRSYLDIYLIVFASGFVAQFKQGIWQRRGQLDIEHAVS